MKRLTLLFVIFFYVTALVKSQLPQFAVVKSNGTTFICPTLDSAYTLAANGDYIYLPGGTFNLSNSISKQIHLIGAGSDEDSTQVTGPTIFSSCTVAPNGSNGSIEGIKISGAINFDGVIPVSNYSVKRCYIGGGLGFSNGTIVENLSVFNCFIGSSSTGGSGFFSFFGTGVCNNSLFNSNVISSYINIGGSSNLFGNNLFILGQLFGSVQLFHGSTYQNNIFQNGMLVSSSSSIFYNNLNGSLTGSSNTVYSWLSEPTDSTFVNPGTINQYGWFVYDKHNNYRLRPSSLGKNTGTDGTDRGLFGGAFPWVDGSVPSNPHIYFKQVAPQTNSNGQLQIQFKVRTGN